MLPQWVKELYLRGLILNSKAHKQKRKGTLFQDLQEFSKQTCMEIKVTHRDLKTLSIKE